MASICEFQPNKPVSITTEECLQTVKIDGCIERRREIDRVDAFLFATRRINRMQISKELLPTAENTANFRRCSGSSARWKAHIQHEPQVSQ